MIGMCRCWWWVGQCVEVCVSEALRQNFFHDAFPWLGWSHLPLTGRNVVYGCQQEPLPLEDQTF